MLRFASAGRRLSTSLSVSQKLAVNGVVLHVVTNGKAQLPALLCMPGGLGTAETDFGPQLRDLASSFQVVSYDPRGYGQSRPPVRDFPINFYQRDADDAAAVMRALGHEKYAVMGWSDGAIAAVKLAATNKQAVDRLVIFGGNAYMGPSDAEAFEAMRDISSWSKRMRETHLAVYGDDLQPMWSSATDAWLAIIKAGGDVCMEEARSIACPTLVLHGAKDPLCLAEHPEWFAKNIPDARLHVFPDGKHNIHLKYSDDVNRMVRDFARPN
eukprot:scaffold168431_cov30-Tisochrysis_lutea.AAC.2